MTIPSPITQEDLYELREQLELVFYERRAALKVARQRCAYSGFDSSDLKSIADFEENELNADLIDDLNSITEETLQLKRKMLIVNYALTKHIRTGSK